MIDRVKGKMGRRKRRTKGEKERERERDVCVCVCVREMMENSVKANEIHIRVIR